MPSSTNNNLIKRRLINMSNNLTGLKELSIKRFISMLETDYKNGDISEDQYFYFKNELELFNLDYQYGLYIGYLIMK